MTDQEAIEILKLYRKRLTDSVSNQLDKDIEAFNVAIKSLGNRIDDKLTCDRNICLKNEYNNIGCEDCVVTKNDVIEELDMANVIIEAKSEELKGE